MEEDDFIGLLIEDMRTIGKKARKFFVGILEIISAIGQIFSVISGICLMLIIVMSSMFLNITPDAIVVFIVGIVFGGFVGIQVIADVFLNLLD